MDINLQENSYGFVKRIRFITDVLRIYKPKTVLDFGCGTGNNVTKPLAEQFADIQFIGIDSDHKTIEHAERDPHPANVSFVITDQLSSDNRFDLIICSEVIEHLDHPDQTLAYLRGKLAPDGILILTLPNGYGPFEFASLIQNILEILRLFQLAIWIKRKIKPSKRHISDADTLAISPHINFFSNREIKTLVHETGFSIIEQRQRTFLCGLLFDQILFSQTMVDMNQKIADYLPYWMNSGWMFVLVPTEYVNKNFHYKRNIISSIRMCLKRLA